MEYFRWKHMEHIIWNAINFKFILAHAHDPHPHAPETSEHTFQTSLHKPPLTPRASPPPHTHPQPLHSTYTEYYGGGMAYLGEGNNYIQIPGQLM